MANFLTKMKWVGLGLYGEIVQVFGQTTIVAITGKMVVETDFIT